jgi:hypothetical protein
MAINYNPRIVTDGMLVCLDAGNRKSYSGSGTTWTDLSGRSNSATLVNTPTYNSLSHFNFNTSTFQHATVSDIGSQSVWTVESWFRITSSLTNQVTTVVCNQFDGVNKLNFTMGTNNAGLVGGAAQWNICVGFFDGSWHNTSGFAPTLNTWTHSVGTYNGTTVQQYKNGATDTSLTYSGTPQSGGANRIARRWDASAIDPLNFFPGDIAVIRIYNRALSATEVQQNFNALRGRFGI